MAVVDSPKVASKRIPRSPAAKTLDSGKNGDTLKKSLANVAKMNEKPVVASFTPASPEPPESRKRKRGNGGSPVVTRGMASKDGNSKKQKKSTESKRRVFYRKVVYDGGEFEIEDDVYVRRREDASSDEEDTEVEDCRVCFKAGKAVMIECDDCLNGFHLKCLKPPLRLVPEGDWICGYCEARKAGQKVDFPEPPKGKKRRRTMREKLLSSDLWAARIER